MQMMLTPDQAQRWLAGSWDAFAVEKDILDHLTWHDITEPVGVFLPDGEPAFGITAPGREGRS